MHFLVVLVFWLTIIFMSFTLSAQPSPMVIGEMIVFALPADWHAFQLRHRWSEPVSPSPGVSTTPCHSVTLSGLRCLEQAHFGYGPMA